MELGVAFLTAPPMDLAMHLTVRVFNAALEERAPAVIAVMGRFHVFLA